MTELKRTNVLSEDSVPSIWPNLPSYCSLIDAPKRLSLNSSGLRCIDDDEKPVTFVEDEERDQKESASVSLDIVESDLSKMTLPSRMCLIREEERLTLLSVTYSPDDGQPLIQYSLVITESLSWKVWKNGLEVQKDNLPSILLKDRLETAHQVLQLLEYFEKNSDINTDDADIIKVVLEKFEQLQPTDKVEFLKEQISLLLLKPNARRYTNDLLATAVLWQKASPACYKQILDNNVLTLPCVRHIRRISSALNVDLELTESAVAYLKARKEKLHGKDLLVSVIMDEVHSKQRVQYCDGKFYGKENGETTKTLLVVMIRSIAGRYRDVVCMSPTHKIKIWTDLIRM